MSLDPENDRAIYLLGTALAMRGQLSDGLPLLELATRLDGTNDAYQAALLAWVRRAGATLANIPMIVVMLVLGPAVLLDGLRRGATVDVVGGVTLLGIGLFIAYLRRRRTRLLSPQVRRAILRRSLKPKTWWGERWTTAQQAGVAWGSALLWTAVGIDGLNEPAMDTFWGSMLLTAASIAIGVWRTRAALADGRKARRTHPLYG